MRRPHRGEIAKHGDFSSVGSARIRYFDVLPQNIGVLTVGTDNYLRAMGAVQPEVAGGRLLIAAEAVGNDGPWQVPEDLRKFNGVLRYTRGDTTGGFHAALMGYDAKWNSTDQIPLDLVESGQLDRFGAIDGTDGGESSRYSLSFGAYKTLGPGQAQIDAYIISYSLDLWSNFTYFLDNQVKGDQFQQTDRRTVYGLIPTYTWANKLGTVEMTNTVGLQAALRRHRQGRPVQDPGARDLRRDPRRRGRRAGGGPVRPECGAVEQLVPLRARPALGLLQLRREQQHTGELRDGRCQHGIAQAQLDLRTLEEDRVLRQRGLRLPQQRCTRHHAARGSERSG